MVVFARPCHNVHAMSKPSDPPRPCHVIAGPLGVGKTTAIIQYVQRHADRQRVAVLVNDFGDVGLDGAIIGGAVGLGFDTQTQIVSIPGGCICCVAADGLVNGLVKVAELPDIDRVMIEPSGLAMPHQIIDLLRQLVDTYPLDLRPVILLMDAGKFHSGWTSEMPYFRNMIDAADVLVANRTDMVDDAAVAEIRHWAQQLYPPKLRFIATHHGQIPDDVFDLVGAPQAKPVDHHHHDHDVKPDQTGGRTWDASIVFDRDALLAAINSLMDEQPLLRLKSIFRTDNGWEQIEYARGQLDRRATGYRRDSRIDWITEQPVDTAMQAWAASLEQCRAAD